MLGEGLNFEGHRVGAVYRTLARTVSETDIRCSWTWNTSRANPSSSDEPLPAR